MLATAANRHKLVYMIEKPASILVVDDDQGIRTLVSEFLQANGFAVAVAADGKGMRAALASSAQPQLIVLDLMMPGQNGLDLCRELRKTSSVPIIMLTAKGDEIDRIIGLEVGADDYLAKPFNPRELLARIHAVLRRADQAGRPASAGAVFRFSGWSLDALKRELTNPNGVVVDLSTGEYDLLLAFLEAPQRVLSRDYLLEQARNRSADSFDRAIDVQISRLRRKIESEGEMIKTIRGFGYMFAPEVARASQ
ncbi:MAG: response regulator [Beijerinckiaceae bacterium]